VPIHYDLFIQALAWFFGIMAFSRLDGSATANVLGAGHPLTRPRESPKTIVWM